MNRSYNENLLQGQIKECFFTREPREENLCIHHVYRGAFRDKSTEYGCWIWLRPDWHNQTNYSIHNDRNLELRIQAMCQMAFEDRYSHEDFMEVFKTDYIEKFRNRYGNISSIYSEYRQRKLVMENAN